MALTAVGAVNNQKQYQTFYDGMGGGWWWGGFGPETATTTMTNTPVSTLVIDMYNAETKHLLWRGTARDTLSDKPQKNEQKLEIAVKKMFDAFPPISK